MKQKDNVVINANKDNTGDIFIRKVGVYFTI